MFDIDSFAALFLIFVSAAMASWGLGFLVRRILLWRGIVDIPKHRSSHSTPTPRGGGIAILAVVLVQTILVAKSAGDGHKELAVILSAGSALAIVSLIDDWKTISAGFRFLCHVAAALAAVAVFTPLTEKVTSLNSISVFVVIAFLWLVGYINAFNFMDGINGLAAGQAMFTCLGMLLVSAQSCLFSFEESQPATSYCQPLVHVFCATIAGSTAGFLPHNFPKARVFMGDVGSAPLGFFLAILVLWIARDFGWELMIPLVLLHANFVLDSGITLLRRIVNREKWYEAHREHFYQRLVRSGRSHRFVTLLEMMLQILAIVLVLFYTSSTQPMRIVLVICILTIWAGFFVFCERSFRQTQFVEQPVSSAGKV